MAKLLRSILHFPFIPVLALLTALSWPGVGCVIHWSVEAKAGHGRAETHQKKNLKSEITIPAGPMEVQQGSGIAPKT